MSRPAQGADDIHGSNGGTAQEVDDIQEQYGGPAQIADDSQIGNGGTAQTRYDSQASHGGPAQKRYGSQQANGGTAQPDHDSHNENGGPAHDPHDSHGGNGGTAQGTYDSQIGYGGPAVWDAGKLAVLRAAGEDLADLIEVRKAAKSRIRTLGHLDTALVGLEGSNPEEPPWIDVAEKAAREALRITYKAAIPAAIRDWAGGIPGFGSGELFPRIIAIIGDPISAVPLLPIAAGDKGRNARSQPAGPPYFRSPHQLWQWCGLGDARSKAREHYLGREPTQEDMLFAGKRSQLPPLLYVWSSQLVKSATPVTKADSSRYGLPVSPAAAESRYWKIFTERKAANASRVHQWECRNHRRPPARPDGCGTSLHPEWGAPGSPWRPGHIDMDAHRIAQKALLMDLWRFAWEAAGKPGPHPETAARHARRERSISRQ